MSTANTGRPIGGGDETLGELLHRRRLELGLTQKQVEARSGGFLSQNYISQVERGEVGRPAFDRLGAFASVLNLPANDLKIAAGYPVVTAKNDLALDTFDPWLKSIGELSREDFERLKAAVREREEHERRQRRGDGR